MFICRRLVAGDLLPEEECIIVHQMNENKLKKRSGFLPIFGFLPIHFFLLCVWGFLVAGCGGTSGVLRSPRLKVEHGSKSLDRWLRSGEQSEITPEIQELAKKLEAEDPWVTLRRINRWVLTHNKQVKRSRAWRKSVFRKRTAAQLLNSGEMTGCGDFAVLLAALFRAAGFPTVYVGSLKKDWVRGWADGNRSGSFMGHSFLEVYVNGEWILVDSTEGYYWRGYDPKNPNLPRGYYAYGKGVDPWDLGIKSLPILIQSMKNIAEKIDPDEFKKPSYRQGFLTPHLVLVSSPKVFKTLKERTKGLRFLFLSIKRLEKNPDKAGGKNVLVLMKTKILPRRIHRIASPLNIDSFKEKLPLDESKYPRVVIQKDRAICVAAAPSAKELAKKALSFIKVRDGDEHALRPELCRRPGNSPKNSPTNASANKTEKSAAKNQERRPAKGHTKASVKAPAKASVKAPAKAPAKAPVKGPAKAR